MIAVRKIEAFQYLITLKISVHHLVCQLFLNDREQLRRAEVKESQASGSVKLY